MRAALLGLFITSLSLLSSNADAKRVKLSIGDTAPQWGKLAGADGKTHAFANLKDAKVIAVIFTCNECPVANAYLKRLAKLHHDFREKGLVLIAINSNKGKSESLKAMQAYAKKHNVEYLYLQDSDQKVAKSFGALLTPEVFLLNRDRKIAYQGAIDDDVKMLGKPKNHYLRDAVKAVLAGEVPKRTSSRALGCTIRWK